ncbi:MAG: YhbY family RNA-binding protein [Endozoicomonadaceae bacterium]|nr:YhbY family RNA-binding protein [Endozoicomonadaceae bacterium]
MALSAEKKHLCRSAGHALNPVVTIAGKGLTENVLAETLRALGDHELIKVRFAVGDREQRQALMVELCEKTAAELVQVIGKVALLYKKAKKPNPRLSNLIRYTK